MRICKAKYFRGISCTWQMVVQLFAIFGLSRIHDGYILLCRSRLVGEAPYLSYVLLFMLPAAGRIKGNWELLLRALQDTRRRL